MERLGNPITFLLLLVLSVSCAEDKLPVGIYHYQVERLLSGQEGEKTWLQVVNSASCGDSLKLKFVRIANTEDDSLDVYQLMGNAECNFNETLVGRASASRQSTGVLFTDSVNFASGDFWIINDLTSRRLNVRIDEENLNFRTD